MNSNHSHPKQGFDPEGDGPDDRPPSKSMLKRAMHELQDLGEQLLAMPDARLKAIEMPERLRDALDDYKRTRSFEGKRRQLQFIGKVLRAVDAEPLREAVAAFQLGHAQNALALHQAERWRADLIREDKDMLTQWVAEFPDTDLQQLRALIRNARKDAAAAPEQRNGRAYRELFQYIKKVLEAQDVSAAPAGADVSADGEGEGDDR
jgi:ribosome-associated protein